MQEINAALGVGEQQWGAGGYAWNQDQYDYAPAGPSLRTVATSRPITAGNSWQPAAGYLQQQSYPTYPPVDFDEDMCTEESVDMGYETGRNASTRLPQYYDRREAKGECELFPSTADSEKLSLSKLCSSITVPQNPRSLTVSSSFQRRSSVSVAQAPAHDLMLISGPVEQPTGTVKSSRSSISMPFRASASRA